ncbi:protein-methionine-sulfoxide reductase heme-binding subunit MsrQ [Pontibacterium granulatum]|uniref:sulfite oxidase heme-binding subunit YedZ n=1 Tax=Pontibacterium granulatum TaxID=2036029 RepID=UPI00249A1539|nr:protein-methionine-sulfoxide reductase heme-binding subunit MsrQ [Pontibacterium granulatum]MDI3325289.1 protein-methionine-sulfoxide reductase heme-binding subunit MsrQ [Pontibacterium granulatum]
MAKAKTKSRWLRYAEWWLVFLLPLVPLGLLTYNAWIFNLGADPAQEIVHETGIWAINLLWITLAITPLRRMFTFSWPMRYRRMLGLYSLFYAVVHLLAFAAFILGWRWDLLLQELVERPYIVVGAAALLLLIPLGVTSTRGMQRRLGRNWLRLHKLVYPIALLVMVHIIWQIRSDFGEQLLYGAILTVLLGSRVYFYLQKKVRVMQAARAA